MIYQITVASGLAKLGFYIKAISKIELNFQVTRFSCI